ncbi:MAG: DUF1080 domain-containing protein [Bryobacteraceae bacterium]|nr:DUF1080 domain-containing protein [Bryobacteraceae bacterium]
MTLRAFAVAAILAAPAPAAEWTDLFDGKTLSGWNDPAKKSPPGNSFTVEDGCIKVVARPKLREDLITDRTFADFELTFEWKVAPRGNSGLKYLLQDHAILDADKTRRGVRFEDLVGHELQHREGDRSQPGPQGKIEAYTVAFEYQVIDDGGHADARRGGLYQAGALYSLVPAAKPMAKPVGEWNYGRIIRRGDRVEHWLNGVKVVDTSLDAPEIRERLAARWKDNPVFTLLTSRPKKRTPIILQNHNDEAWFRNLRIRELQ